MKKKKKDNGVVIFVLNVKCSVCAKTGQNFLSVCKFPDLCSANTMINHCITANHTVVACTALYVALDKSSCQMHKNVNA